MDSLTGGSSGDVRSQVHTGQPQPTRRTTGFDPERTFAALLMKLDGFGWNQVHTTYIIQSEIEYCEY